jgi:hypothetical protein
VDKQTRIEFFVESVVFTCEEVFGTYFEHLKPERSVPKRAGLLVAIVRVPRALSFDLQISHDTIIRLICNGVVFKIPDGLARTPDVDDSQSTEHGGPERQPEHVAFSDE